MTNQEKLFLSKQAMFGVGKALGGIPWLEGSKVGLSSMPSTAGIGSLLGGAGNALLGDERQALAERILKGMLYGGGIGAASSIPLGIGALTGVDKTLGSWIRKQRALRQLHGMAPAKGVSSLN